MSETIETRDAASILAANRDAGRTVAVAESCTGGMVCAALTDVPGSSDVFVEGFVTYSNDAKMRTLGVKEDILDTFGAVSQATAWAMVEGALKRSGADVAVAITGVAGPSGGSERKPVGLVIFARGMKGQQSDDFVTHKVQFASQDRAAIRRSATRFALDLLHPDHDGDAAPSDLQLDAP